MDTIQGTIDHIRYCKEDTGWTVAMLGDGTTITGVLFGVTPGMAVTLHGEWETHKTYGDQFRVKTYRTARPSTVEAIAIYLQEMVYGIGPHLAKEITGYFGSQTPEIMSDPHKLALVPGIGQIKAVSICDSWKEHEAERAILEDLLTFFVQNGLPTGLAHKAFKRWGYMATEKINENPYILIELEGVGFKRADAIALALGIEKTSPHRIQAAIEYVLSQATMNGHCYLDIGQVTSEAQDLLTVDRPLIGPQIEALVSRERVIIEGSAVYARRLWDAENEVAKNLRRLFLSDGLNDIQTDVLPGGIAYTPTQERAIRAAFENKVSIITGGPGTGKTTITRAIVELAGDHHVTLCSPSGKAAKRLSQATGKEAATIHRTLGIDEEVRFICNEHNPLETALVIVDEASMLDISLVRRLLAAVPNRAHVVFVGDVDQLPAVGPGNVLRDMIDSGSIPTTRLDIIFRQGGDSYIIPNAHAINRGEMPTYNKGLGGDFYLDVADDAATAAAKVVELVAKRIPESFGYKPDSIQVLTPMHRGEAGDDALNAALQAVLNPPSPNKAEVKVGFTTFRVGDVVIQCKNDYEHNIFNGDQGRIVRIAEDEDKKPAVWIEFDGDLKKFKPSELGDMRLAYTITVHKSQGSEFPVVVMPVLTQHFVMLQRNLLYTGVTRAKSLVVLVGNQKAVAIAVKNDKIAKRNTKLSDRLKTAL